MDFFFVILYLLYSIPPCLTQQSLPVNLVFRVAPLPDVPNYNYPDPPIVPADSAINNAALQSSTVSSNLVNENVGPNTANSHLNNLKKPFSQLVSILEQNQATSLPTLVNANKNVKPVYPLDNIVGTYNDNFLSSKFSNLFSPMQANPIKETKHSRPNPEGDRSIKINKMSFRPVRPFVPKINKVVSSNNNRNVLSNNNRYKIDKPISQINIHKKHQSLDPTTQASLILSSPAKYQISTQFTYSKDQFANQWPSAFIPQQSSTEYIRAPPLQTTDANRFTLNNMPAYPPNQQINNFPTLRQQITTKRTTVKQAINENIYKSGVVTQELHRIPPQNLNRQVIETTATTNTNNEFGPPIISRVVSDRRLAPKFPDGPNFVANLNLAKNNVNDPQSHIRHQQLQPNRNAQQTEIPRPIEHQHVLQQNSPSIPIQVNNYQENNYQSRYNLPRDFANTPPTNVETTTPLLDILAIVKEAHRRLSMIKANNVNTQTEQPQNVQKNVLNELYNTQYRPQDVTVATSTQQNVNNLSILRLQNRGQTKNQGNAIDVNQLTGLNNRIPQGTLDLIKQRFLQPNSNIYQLLNNNNILNNAASTTTPAASVSLPSGFSDTQQLLNKFRSQMANVGAGVDPRQTLINMMSQQYGVSNVGSPSAIRQRLLQAAERMNTASVSDMANANSILEPAPNTNVLDTQKPANLNVLSSIQAGNAGNSSLNTSRLERVRSILAYLQNQQGAAGAGSSNVEALRSIISSQGVTPPDLSNLMSGIGGNPASAMQLPSMAGLPPQLAALSHMGGMMDTMAARYEGQPCQPPPPPMNAMMMVDPVDPGATECECTFRHNCLGPDNRQMTQGASQCGVRTNNPMNMQQMVCCCPGL